MNKKTYGEGVRTERTDHAVVAETIAAKEKLRDQLGVGEDVRVENISKAEMLARRMIEARANHAEAVAIRIQAEAHEREMLTVYQDASRAWLKAREEEDNARANHRG